MGGAHFSYNVAIFFIKFLGFLGRLIASWLFLLPKQYIALEGKVLTYMIQSLWGGVNYPY